MSHMISLRKYLRDYYDAKDTPQYYYELMLMEKASTLFDWEGLPDGLPVRELERMLLFTPSATAGIVRKKDGSKAPYNCPYIAVPLSNTGEEMTVYNEGLKWMYTTNTQGGRIKEDDDDVVIGFNNRCRIPLTLLVMKYADLFEEIDKSLKIGIIRTRATKILRASSDAAKVAIDNIMNDVTSGQYCTMYDGNNFKDLVTGEGAIESVDLSDGYTANDLNALMLLRKELFSQFMMEIAIPITDIPKKSQVNTGELQGYDDYAEFSASDMLASRKEMAEKMNEKFGWEVSVDYNPVIKKIIERREENEEQQTKESAVQTDTTSGDNTGDNSDGLEQDTDTGKDRNTAD